ncbi:Uncharacterized protein OBRU01_11898 [Operophtera brumata]|uniref:Uncharacterized protein n=1 Tax=Operophtera brumata TaxID=104452 RepID=A0A0L7LB35_OPEBR|nr:Uncharacterized protein OBRU01_11898 [Operophtera brumata]
MDSRVAVLRSDHQVKIVSNFSPALSRKKKVVIHVPYKVKKIKHTHTVYKTIHHHHAHPHKDHAGSPSEEHEHFHHLHLHEEPPSLLGAHSQPVGGLAIPEFLPDVPMEVPDIPDVARDISGLNRLIPLYRRT